MDVNGHWELQVSGHEKCMRAAITFAQFTTVRVYWICLFLLLLDISFGPSMDISCWGQYKQLVAGSN